MKNIDINQIVKELSNKRKEMMDATFLRVIFDVNNREAFKQLMKTLASMTLLRRLTLLHRLHHQHFSFGTVGEKVETDVEMNEQHSDGI